MSVRVVGLKISSVASIYLMKSICLAYKNPEEDESSTRVNGVDQIVDTDLIVLSTRSEIAYLQLVTISRGAQRYYTVFCEFPTIETKVRGLQSVIRTS